MSLNPETLREEGEEERRERQGRTGVLGNGITVFCQPYPWDPSIVQHQHRAVCMRRPYPACLSCPHQTFTLIFRANPEDPYEMLACPRWRNGEKDRLAGKSPDSYVPVERAFCYQRPFEFCPSCPSAQLLVDIGADKVRPGWYGRWHRFTTEGDDDERTTNR